MASWSTARWQPSDETALPRADRRHGPYRRYVPDAVSERALLVDAALARRATEAERAVRNLSTDLGATGLEGVSRFLLRSEAIASSLIEGIGPSPQHVALAELAQVEQVRGFSDQARLVANNITLLRRAVQELSRVDEVSITDVEALHRALLPVDRHHGLRNVQNWIGGSSRHPLDAAFVPPQPELVRPLMDDLLVYLNGSAHAPLIQAALVHAQFETIHPFTDGNGRVGRALIHTVLARRGMTPHAVLPVSVVLGARRDAYVAGLTAYRYEGPMTDAAAHDGITEWLHVFLEASAVAAGQALHFSGEIATLRKDWAAGVAVHRLSSGLRGTPRADSATARLLRVLPEAPILTARTVQRLLGVSFPAARTALEELAGAGILIRRSVERGTTGYSAMDVFDLLGHTERRLANTRWDPRDAP